MVITPKELVSSGNLKTAPCGDGRLKKHLPAPVFAHNLQGRNLRHHINFLTHEFVHMWSAYLSYVKDGEKERLTNHLSGIHWRGDLHSPAAFPRQSGQESSIMGGSFWTQNGNGTFTPNATWDGLSWLDLYAMGLAHDWEVPDVFILRSLEAIASGHHNPRGEMYRGGVYTGDKEIVSPLSRLYRPKAQEFPTRGTNRRTSTLVSSIC